MNTPSNGRFEKGKSGNPSGRPAGSRNKATLVIEQILEREAEQIMTMAVEMAKAGNPHAMRLCIERMAPVRKERNIEMAMRPVENPNDLPITLVDVIGAMAQGEVTTREGADFAAVIAMQATVVEAKGLAQRVKELESHLDMIQRFERGRDRIHSEVTREP